MRLLGLPAVGLFAAGLCGVAAAADRIDTVDAAMKDCRSLQACLRILDDATGPDIGRYYPNSPKLAGILSRFGRPAKQELLRRGAEAESGQANVALDILAAWPSLEQADVPLLARGLERDHGGEAARALERIGTPEAIRALAADLPHGAESQTGGALRDLGVVVLPYVSPLLADDTAHAEAERVISGLGAAAAAAAPGWIAQAADARESESARLGALRGLAALQPPPAQPLTALHSLLTGPSKALRRQALTTLAAVRDPVVLPRLVASCQPVSERVRGVDLDPTARIAQSYCLFDLAEFGPALLPHAEPLLNFLDAPEGDDRTDAATALGFVGYRPAAPVLIDRLEDIDWRVAYAAARSLGWMREASARSALERVTASHWLPELRAEARTALAEIAGGPLTDRPPSLLRLVGQITPESVFHDQALPCPSERWSWKGQTFEPAGNDSFAPAREVPVLGGVMLGTNHGEWGGAVEWRGGFGASHLRRQRRGSGADVGRGGGRLRRRGNVRPRLCGLDGAA